MNRRHLIWPLLIATGLLSCAGTPAQESQPSTAGVRKRATDAESAGDHARAAEAFLELTRLESTNPQWFVSAAENLGKIGRFNDAMDLLTGTGNRFVNAVEVDTTLAKTFHMKADAMVAEGIFDVNVTFYYEDAARTAKRVLDRQPDHLEAQLLHASARFQLNDFDGALTTASKAATSNPTHYGAQAMLGKISLQAFISARQAFERDNPAGTARKERREAIEAARERAIAALSAAAKADPKRSYPIVKLGDVHAWNGDLTKAVEKYGEGLAVDPDAKFDRDWLRTATKPEVRVQLYEGAIAAYTARGGKDPKQRAALQWYAARARYDAKDWDAARKGFADSLRGRPDFFATYYYLMQSCYWGGKQKDAAKHALAFASKAPRKFADMIRRDEQTTAVLRGMAQRSFQSGRLVECRELNQVIAYATNSVDEWNNYALLCRDTGKFQESFTAYERAIEIEESPQLLNDAAVILQYHLRSDESIRTATEYYERAIELAKEMLEDSSLDSRVAERTRIALRDARSNLRKLRRR